MAISTEVLRTGYRPIALIEHPVEVYDPVIEQSAALLVRDAALKTPRVRKALDRMSKRNPEQHDAFMNPRFMLDIEVGLTTALGEDGFSKNLGLLRKTCDRLINIGQQDRYLKKNPRGLVENLNGNERVMNWFNGMRSVYFSGA